MFLFKKKKITVDAFTTNDHAHNFFPVEKASSFIPKWLANTPAHYTIANEHGAVFKNPTIKRCVGLQDIYKQGLIIPLWSDAALTVKANGDYAWMFADQNTSAQAHPRQQYSNGFDNLLHLKILSPWMFREKTGVNFVWTQPTWNMLDLIHNISIPPAVINYKYQIGTHINMLFPKVAGNIELFAGQPMAHIIPLSDSYLEVKTHIISDQEKQKLDRVYNTASSFLAKYVHNKKLMQALEK
jgi:hypothetical protein